MDILLDENTHDCVFINGDTPVTMDIADGLKQKLKIKLLTFKGEWFLNTSYGTPYFQEIFGKSRSKSTVDAIFRNLIVEEKEVAEITKFQSILSTDRLYSLEFAVRSITGDETDIINLEVSV